MSAFEDLPQIDAAHWHNSTLTNVANEWQIVYDRLLNETGAWVVVSVVDTTGAAPGTNPFGLALYSAFVTLPPNATQPNLRWLPGNGGSLSNAVQHRIFVPAKHILCAYGSFFQQRCTVAVEATGILPAV